MRQLFALLLLVPFGLCAQLSKMRGDMTETEFLKTFPEAKRDLQDEAKRIKGSDTIYGMAGQGSWQIYNDTVTIYDFFSFTAQGPSSAHPKDDSTDVHKMKLAADDLRKNLETHVGKPTAFRNFPLMNVNDGQLKAYDANWKFADSTSITIVINRLPPGGEITRVEADDYYMQVIITRRELWVQNIFSVGMDAKTFFIRKPQFADQIDPTDGHRYRLPDSLTAENAGWRFIFFSSGALQRMIYSASVETTHDAKANEMAYSKLKAKSEQFIIEGNAAFGKPDTLLNQLKVPYVMPEASNDHIKYVLAEWKTKTGEVYIKFAESGSTYFDYSYFSLEVFVSPKQ